jgi:transforming growth factor-beta-induced protein
MPADKTVADILGGSGVFGDFEQAIITAGLGDLLSTQGTYTVFAPSDEAFAKHAGGRA